MSDLIMVISGFLLILLTVAVNLLLMPFLLFIVLGAFGIELSFWICWAIWVLGSTIIRILK